MHHSSFGNLRWVSFAVVRSYLILRCGLGSKGIAPKTCHKPKASRSETIHEPSLSLRGSSIGERVWYDGSLSFFLQVVVSDRGRDLQGLVGVAWIEALVLLLRAVRRNTGDAIGLQFDGNLERVSFSLAG